jgi:D-sedoheptulose 7-phosphate isomerase
MKIENDGIARYAREYADRLRSALEDLDPETLDVVVDALRAQQRADRSIYLCGNGGGASNASHFASDLNKLASSDGNGKFRAMALTDNISTITAWANDGHYDQIFVRQLDNLLRQDDCLIGFSCSGNSENVVSAVRLARDREARTIGFLGCDGGRLKDLVEHRLWVRDDHFGVIEDGHSILCHIIANYLATG